MRKISCTSEELTTSQSGQVNASAAAVWALLTDVNRWEEWNPAVVKSNLLEGDGQAVGSKVDFLPMIGDKKAKMMVKLTVAKSEKFKALEYNGKPLGSKIVFGFTISQNGKVCTVTSYETISGMVAKTITQENLDKEHRTWVEAIKQKLEQKNQ